MPEMSRRQSIQTVVCSVVLFAGCNEPRKSEGSNLEITVYNLRETSQEIEVQVLRSDEILFQKVYHLDAGMVDESEKVSRTPTRILVDVHGESTETFGYSAPANCDTPEINIRIQDGGNILVNNGCPEESI